MTRCHKVIVDFIFIACEQALHSKGQAEQAAWEKTSEQLAARGRGKPILSLYPKKTADILPRHRWLPRKMTSD